MYLLYKASSFLALASFLIAGSSLLAQDFCDSRITVINSALPPSSSACCFDLFIEYPIEGPDAITVTDYNVVGVNGASSFFENVKAGFKSYAWSYCIPSGASRTVIVEIYGAGGAVICHKEFFIECEGQDCCDALQPQVFPADPGGYIGCKGTIEICPDWLETCPGATITTTHGTLSWLNGCASLSYCIPLGSPSVTFSFDALDAFGDVLCTTTHTITCGGGPGTKTVAPGELLLTNQDTEQPALRVHPNPAGDRLGMSFNILERQRVTIMLYDQLGRSVAQLHNGSMDAGSYAIQRSVSAVPPGTYIVSLVIGSKTFSTQVVITQ